MSDEITICSVSYHSAEFLRLNERAVRELNPDAKIHWLVAENSPTHSARRLGARDNAFDLIEGPGPGHIATYHHTLALRACTNRSRTRFVAVIDPDLFIVRRDWVGEVLNQMRSRELSFIGVPWHPQSKGKYRYFPAVHWSVFDTERFPREQIDFLPDYPDGDDDPVWKAGWTLDTSYFARSRVARLLGRWPVFAARRQHYTDTGSRFYKRSVDDPKVRYEVLVPRAQAPTPPATVLGRLLHAALPDELCYEPKHYPIATFDVDPELRAVVGKMPKTWECFEWRRKLFCFHVRGNLDRGDRDARTELAIATQLVDAAVASAPP